MTKQNWAGKNLAGFASRPVHVVSPIHTRPWENWPYGLATLPPLQPLLVHFWQRGWFQLTLSITATAAVLFCLWLLAQLTAQAKSQKVLQQERVRIARDIHDDLGAQLTQLLLLGEVAQREQPELSLARGQFTQICDHARELAHALDEVVWAVNARRDTVRDFTSYVCKGVTSSGANGSLIGQGGITKSGGGVLAIDLTNNLSGPVLISSGTLQIGNFDANGSLGSSIVTNNGSLSVARADTALNLANTIHGSGTLIVQGSGALTISGNNDFTGLGTAAGNTSVAPGAQLYVTANVDLAEPLSVNGAGRFLLGTGVTIANAIHATIVSPGAATGLIMVADNTNGIVTTVSGPLTFGASPANGGNFYGPGSSGYLNVSGRVTNTVTGVVSSRDGRACVSPAAVITRSSFSTRERFPSARTTASARTLRCKWRPPAALRLI